LGPGRIFETDLRAAQLPRAHYDLVFARWVFLFLPDAEAHLRLLARALKPGGRIAIQDYHRETFVLVPRPGEWNDFMAADRAFFAAQGGDVSIGGRLPGLYRKAGLEVVGVTPTIKSGGPGSAVWRWLTTYFLGVMPRLAALRPFTPAKAARLGRAWREAGRDPSSLMIAPALLDVVGRKP
jgi:SAM-dependent methyltransferase